MKSRQIEVCVKLAKIIQLPSKWATSLNYSQLHDHVLHAMGLQLFFANSRSSHLRPKFPVNQCKMALINEFPVFE